MDIAKDIKLKEYVLSTKAFQNKILNFFYCSTSYKLLKEKQDEVKAFQLKVQQYREKINQVFTIISKKKVFGIDSNLF